MTNPEIRTTQTSEELWKSIMIEELGCDILVFLMNANLEEHRDWIYFVLINLRSLREEEKIKILRLFFLIRKSNFSHAQLEEFFPNEVKSWERVEKKLVADWEKDFSSQPALYYSVGYVSEQHERPVRLIFKKYVCNGKNDENWKEWELLSKASFAHDFHLLGEVIFSVIVHFSEERIVEDLPDGKETDFIVELDIEPKTIPDILITSKKDNKRKLGIEIVRVSSTLVKLEEKGKYQELDKLIGDILTNLIKDNRGKLNSKIIKEAIKIRSLKKPKIDKNSRGESVISWKLPEVINTVSYLMDRLKENVSKKSSIWKKKGFKNLVLWAVISTVFIIYVHDTNEIIRDKEIQSKFLWWYLLEKVFRNLSDTKLDFDYLVITFLGINHYEKDSLLNKYSPQIKAKKNLKGEHNLLKYFSSTGHVEVAIPNLYITIKNGKIKNLEEDLKELERKFKEKFGFDINSLKFSEFSPTDYVLYDSNLEDQ